MSVQRILFVLMMLVILAPQFFVPIALADTSEDQAAASALANAEESIVSAYQAVLKAEESGANVSSLLIRLNDAGWFLVRARLAYKFGDSDSTIEFAAQSQEKLSGFVADADALKEAAISERHLDFLINVVGSIVGAVAVAFVGFVSWFFLKRKHEKTGSAA